MKYKVGDKVWVEYGFSIYKGKVLGVKDDGRYIVRYKDTWYKGTIAVTANSLTIRRRI